jgi:hypothetical protein
VIVTSQSADLPDSADRPVECPLAVEMSEGSTIIGPIDSASRKALRWHLFTPGELMRETAIHAEPQTAGRQS